MPSRRCAHPTCTEYVKPPALTCAAHPDAGRALRREHDRQYDRRNRDRDAKSFYNSVAWARARGAKLVQHPVCQRCGAAWSHHVHHVKPLKECTEAEKVSPANLRALCAPCHSAVELETRSACTSR